MAAAFIWAAAAVVARISAAEAALFTVVARISVEAAALSMAVDVNSADLVWEAHAISVEAGLEARVISAARANSVEAAMSGPLVRSQGREVRAMPAAPLIAGPGMPHARRLSAQELLQRQTAWHG